MQTAEGQHIVWQPQSGPQTDLIQCPVFEILFGGARGGGKTEGSIGDWLEHQHTYGNAAIGVFFRRKFKQLEEVVARTRAIFPLIGAKWNEQKAEWTMANKARLKFRYIERDSDAEEYQGHSYTRVYIEEVTNFPSSRPINLLRATLRSALGVPVGMRLTGNPGGPGHNWVKGRYITPAPLGWRLLQETFEIDGVQRILDRIFIPSRISDNPLLTKNDPLYVARLRQVGSEALVKAWLTGNWDLVEGAYFDEWDEERHVLRSAEWLHKIPANALRFAALDWGSRAPFSIGWYVVSDGTWGLPRGALLKYREWYGASGPNVGLKMDATMVAKGMLTREVGERIRYRVADPSIFAKDGGPSIAELFAVNGVSFLRGDNKRQPGWEQMHYRFKGENGRPMLYMLDCCEDSIRTIPVLQHDETNSEDVDTEGEDHAGDETRYACMSRPWVPGEVDTGDEALPLWKPPTFNEAIAERTRRRLATME